MNFAVGVSGYGSTFVSLIAVLILAVGLNIGFQIVRGCHVTWCWHGSGCCLPDAASHKYSIRQTLVSQAAA